MSEEPKLGFWGTVKKYWKPIAGVFIAIFGFILGLFVAGGKKDPNGPANFVKDPKDPTKIKVSGDHGVVGVKLPTGVKNDAVETVSKPTTVVSTPVQVDHKAKDRKGEKKDEKNPVDAPPAGGSAADWLGANNDNFKSK